MWGREISNLFLFFVFVFNDPKQQFIFETIIGDMNI